VKETYRFVKETYTGIPAAAGPNERWKAHPPKTKDLEKNPTVARTPCEPGPAAALLVGEPARESLHTQNPRFCAVSACRQKADRPMLAFLRRRVLGGSPADGVEPGGSDLERGAGEEGESDETAQAGECSADPSGKDKARERGEETEGGEVCRTAPPAETPIAATAPPIQPPAALSAPSVAFADGADACAPGLRPGHAGGLCREAGRQVTSCLRLAEELSAELLRIRQDTSTLADPQHSRAIGEVRASDAQWGPSGAGNVELGGPRNLGKARMQIANARRLAEELSSDLELML